jgi:hypothetical protein
MVVLAEIPNYQVRYSQHTLDISNDAGATWKPIPIFSTINTSTYICSATRHPQKPDYLLVGTSFQGIYESTDSGRTWRNLTKDKSFKPIAHGNGFINEISDIQYNNTENFDFHFIEGFSGKAWEYIRSSKSLQLLPQNSDLAISKTIHPSPYSLPKPTHNHDPESRAQRRITASNRRAIYLNPSASTGKALDRNLDFVVKNKMNAIVVDFKDDIGNLTYTSNVTLAKANKASKPRIDPASLIRKAHARNIYVIARIVVFKDQTLYAYQKNAYALWDRVRKQPWGVFRNGQQIEFWVDPFSEVVHQYNIDLANEAVTLGVDEIQFDYIRFPSDGLPQNIQSRFNAKKSLEPYDRVLALSTFLAKARSEIKVPISTDVYGFNGWARMSYLGQDIQAFANYVDVISPMAYPSHYDMSFLSSMTFFDRAEFIHSEGTKRAKLIIEEQCLIRPYVQAFLIGNERQFSYPQAYEYLNRQIKGVFSGGGSGFALWNNSGDYYMVQTSTFTKIVEAGS